MFNAWDLLFTPYTTPRSQIITNHDVTDTISDNTQDYIINTSFSSPVYLLYLEL